MKGKPNILNPEITRLRSSVKASPKKRQKKVPSPSRIYKPLNDFIHRISEETGIVIERIINDNLQEILIKKYPQLFRKKK